MPRSRLAALALLPLLGSCALIGADLPPRSALERELSGTFEGVGSGLTGRVPYRLTLSVQEGTGRAAGALENLESRKTYAASGTFVRLADGPQVELKLYEGRDQRGNLYLGYADGAWAGTLRTVLLGRELLSYRLDLRRSDQAAPSPTPPGMSPAAP